MKMLDLVNLIPQILAHRVSCPRCQRQYRSMRCPETSIVMQCRGKIEETIVSYGKSSGCLTGYTGNNTAGERLHRRLFNVLGAPAMLALLTVFELFNSYITIL